MKARRAAVLACAGAAASALVTIRCAHLTEILVVVDSDLEVGARIDTIAISVDGPSGFHVERQARLANGALPISLGVQAGADDAAAITVTAKALKGGAEVAATIVRTRFAARESRVLPVALCGACLGIACPSSERCDRGGCVSVEVPSASLPPADGFSGRVACARRPAGDGGDVSDSGLDGDAGGCPGCPAGFSCGDGGACVVPPGAGQSCAQPVEIGPGGGKFTVSSCGRSSVTCNASPEYQGPAAFFRCGVNPQGTGYTVSAGLIVSGFFGPVDTGCSVVSPCKDQILAGAADVPNGSIFAVGRGTTCGEVTFTVTPK